MRWIKTIPLFVLLVISFSCKKKKYPPSEVIGEPEFYVKATINQADYLYRAGIDSYRMYSSYVQDSGVYKLSAALKINGCGNNCANSFDIRISDYKESAAGEPINIDSTLKKGFYNLALSPQLVQFKSSFNKQAQNYLWRFGDGSTSTQANPSHIYQKMGKYTVSLTITSNSGCVSTISYPIKVGYSQKATSAAVIQSSTNGNTISFKNNVLGGRAPFTYFWTFGDSATTSTVAEPTYRYRFTGAYPVTLRVIDAANDTTYTKFNAVTQGDASSCVANFSVVSVSPSPQLVNKALSQSFITWVNEAGIVFKSVSLTQTSDSFFEVVSVEDYDTNENGDKTKKIKVRFRCQLADAANNIARIENAEAVICVAYK